MNRIAPATGLLLFPVLGFSLTACSDYDLHRPDKAEQTGEDTSTPVEPPEDPDISVSPASIDFGGIPKDCPSDPIAVTITNDGLADLTVSSIELDGSGTSAFSHTHNGSEIILAYQDTYTFEVNFTPNAWVDFEIDVDVRSNDPDEPKVEVPTTGSGAEDNIFEEGFIQEYNEVVDVLWLVDNSCSMGEELNQVRTNFQSFITEFVGLDLDYNLAVITTDMDNPTHSGKIQGEIISPAHADPEGAFLAAIDQGSGGSGSEKGFEAIETALTEPLVSTDNAGFLRSNAALSVIALTDENDSSSISSASFISWLDGLKGDPEQTSFSAICGDRGLGCQEFDFSGNTLSASGGDKYIDAADQTEGFWASICTSDYDEVLQHISLTAAGMTVSFELSQEPSNLTDVSVEVEGVEISNDQDNGWTYDSEFNAIVFHGDSIPGPDESVLVSYPVAAECPN